MSRRSRPVLDLVFVVDGIPRSGKNSQRRRTITNRSGQRQTISMQSLAAEQWTHNALAQIAMQRPLITAQAGPFELQLLICHALPLTAWDADNVLNLSQDALKKARIITDDCAAVLRRIVLDTDVDKARPRVEMRLLPYTRIAA